MRELPVMIRWPKSRILELVMQIQSPMGTREKRAGNINRNSKNPEDGSAELQSRE